MGFHDRYHVDKAAEEEGTWVDLGDNVAVKVRRFTSAHSKAVRRKLEEPHAALARGGQQLPDTILEEILIKQMALSLIVDWKGVPDDTGQPLQATPENFEKVLREYPEFRNEIGSIVMDRATWKKQVRETDLKNS